MKNISDAVLETFFTVLKAAMASVPSTDSKTFDEASEASMGL